MTEPKASTGKPANRSGQVDSTKKSAPKAGVDVSATVGTRLGGKKAVANPFQDGCLWFDVKSISGDGKDFVGGNSKIQGEKNSGLVRPLWSPIGQTVDGITGSLMPYLEISIPNLFFTKNLPYESIVSFEYDVWPGVGKAKLQFVDPSPVFFETVTRKMFNQRNDAVSNYALEVKYGWRITDVGAASRVDKNQFYDRTNSTFAASARFLVMNLDIDFSAQGVLYTFELQRSSWEYVNNQKIIKGDLKSKFAPDPAVLDKDTLGGHIADFVNNNTPNKDLDYTVIFSPDDLPSRLNLEETQDLADTAFEQQTVSEAIQKIVNTLSIEVKDRNKFAGTVKWTASEQPIKLEDDTLKNAIIIYEYDPRPEKYPQIYPVVRYPAHDSPIITFNPKFDMELMAWMNAPGFVKRDSQGNIIDQSKIFPRANPHAGFEGRTSTSAQTQDAREMSWWDRFLSLFDDDESGGAAAAVKKLVGTPEAEVANLPTLLPVMATVEMDMYGDPSWSTNAMFTQWVLVNMEAIHSEGMFASDDFFSNFKQLNQSRQKVRPSSAEAMGDGNPINGFYKIEAVQHKIDASNGFVTAVKVKNFGTDPQTTQPTSGES